MNENYNYCKPRFAREQRYSDMEVLIRYSFTSFEPCLLLCFVFNSCLQLIVVFGLIALSYLTRTPLYSCVLLDLRHRKGSKCEA